MEIRRFVKQTSADMTRSKLKVIDAFSPSGAVICSCHDGLNLVNLELLDLTTSRLTVVSSQGDFCLLRQMLQDMGGRSKLASV